MCVLDVRETKHNMLVEREIRKMIGFILMYKMKFTLEQAAKTHKGSRGIALLFL